MGLIIPSGPGAIGSFELLSVVVFTVYAVDRSVALSTAVVVHGMGIGVTVIVGTPMLLRGIVFSNFRSSKSKNENSSIEDSQDGPAVDSTDEAVV